MTARTLHLLRHGETTLPGRFVGRTDVPATPDGIAACVAQAQRIGFDRIVSSDLIRTRNCAEAIGTPMIDPRWRELDFGDWDGLASTEIDAGALGRFWENPDTDPPPDGERWSSLVARVADAIAASPPGETLVVTHGGPMRAALAHLFGFDQRQLWSFDLPYAALLTLRLWDDAAQIVGLAPCVA